MIGHAMHDVAEKLMAIADDIRADIKQARSDGDNDRRHYLRGELQGILSAYDLVTK
jgi:hypothetical protein